MNQHSYSHPGCPVCPGVQRPPGRGPVRSRPATGAPGLCRQERLHRGPRVRGRGRERENRRPSRVQQDDRRRQQARFSLQRDIGLEVLQVHPQAGARRGLQVHAPQAGNPGNVSITEHADDSPTGKLMEAIIESVDEFYSRKSCRRGLARGMREAASRGFWMSAYAPYGYKRRSKSRTGPRNAPSWNYTRLPTAWCGASSRWPCWAPAPWKSPRPLTGKGIVGPKRGRWTKTTIHRILTTETYTGTLVWGTRMLGTTLRPCRVENAFPAIVSKDEFERVSGHS